jgi:hypothetical protein
MAANDLTINQISTVLGEIVGQATGSKPMAVTDTSSFVTVAQIGLKTGYDTLATAISQVLSRTIFSTRPYNRKFGGLEVSNQRYGNHVRKLSPIDKEPEDDERYALTEGGAVDHYKVSKPLVQQTNFYGVNAYQRHLTTYRDQLDIAFRSPDEFSSFLSMMLSNVSDMIEQDHENTARATVANLIGGAIDLAGTNVIHCLAEYNAITGGTYTAETVLNPDTIVGFAKYLVARINTTAKMLTERSNVFHQTIGGKTVMRHTPVERQKAYIYTDYLSKVYANVFSTVFNENYLKIADTEEVNFWQSIKTPGSINVTPAYTDGTSGNVVKGKAVNKPILAVLFDEEAAGYTVVNQWTQNTPMNAAGGYYNTYWHFTDRYWNDFTENHVVFVLD